MKRAVLGLTLSTCLAACGGEGSGRVRDAAADAAADAATDAATGTVADLALDGPHGEGGGEVGAVDMAIADRPAMTWDASVDERADLAADQIPDALADVPEGSDVALVPVDAPQTEPDLAPGIPECFDNNPCTLDVLDGQTCRHSPVADGTPCTDGNACTLGDSCQAGLCRAGTAQNGSLTELGRVEAFGIEAGTIIPTRDDRMLFVDPAYPYILLHVTSISSGALSVLGAEYPRPEQAYAYLPASSSLISDGWPGHAAFGSSYDYSVSLVTIDASGAPTLHTTFELPISGGFLAGNLNGLAGHGDTLWACVNYSFFGPASGTLYRYDIADPEAPVLVQAVNLSTACGSTAIADEGRRVYINTSNGIYWLDLTGADGGADGGVDGGADDGADGGANGGTRIVLNGPFGANTGLAVVGSTLLSRSTTSLVLYDIADHSEILRIDQAGLVASTYLPELQLVALVRREQRDGIYERWLQINDARAGGSGTLLDQVLLDNASSGNARIVAIGDVLIDAYSKAAFRVVAGKLVRTSMPMLGGVGTLASGLGGTGVWSATSWRALDISDPSHPTFLSPGGPILGRQRGIGLDIRSQPLVLLDDLGYAGQSSLPGLGRVRTSTSYRRDGDAFVVALRDGEGWTQSTEAGRALLSGIEPGILQWSSESLFRVDTPSAGQVRLRRWDQSQLLSSTSADPREDRSFALADMPAAARSPSSMIDFPERGDLGLLVVGYSLSQDGGSSYHAILTWLDRSTPTTTLVEQVPVDGLKSAVRDCRVAQNRAVCLTSSQMMLVEKGAQPGSAVVHWAPMNSAFVGLLAFDGDNLFLSRQDAFEVVSFAKMLAWEPVESDPSADGGMGGDAGLPDAVRIPLSSYPLSVSETKDALLVSSLYEVVTLKPHCLGR